MANADRPLTTRERAIRTYVLRTGRMTDAQKDAYERLLPVYGIEWDPDRAIDARADFGNDGKLFVEIGFGMGAATWRIAQARPEDDFVGIEVHTPGVGKLLAEIEANGIRNLKVAHHDAVEVVERMMRPASIDGFHVFYPDPWEKKRHHKRRIIQGEFTALLASRLVPGGYLYFVSDIEEYALWSLEVLSATPGLENAYDGFAPRREWRPVTKFEGRADKVGRPAYELWFVKR